MTHEEGTTPDRPRQVPALTGIRLVAAGWVVALHYWPFYIEAIPIVEPLGPLAKMGYTAVDLFFVLSGFVIALNYSERFRVRHTARDAGGFLWLRLARIYPVHLFTLHVFLLLYAIQVFLNGTPDGDARVGWVRYVQNLLLVHIWFGQGGGFNGPAWSISAEWFAYLSFPLLASFLLPRINGFSRCLIASVVCYVPLVLMWVFYYWDSATSTSGALLRVECGFMAGCFLYKAWRDRPATTVEVWVMSTGALTALLIGCYELRIFEHHRGVVLAPLFAVLLYAAASAQGPVARVLSSRVFIFGGEASYSLYMTHALLIPVLNVMLPPADLGQMSVPVRLLLIVGILVAIGVAAVGTYLAVEVPSRMWMRSLLARRSARRSTRASRTQRSR